MGFPGIGTPPPITSSFLKIPIFRCTKNFSQSFSTSHNKLSISLSLHKRDMMFIRAPNKPSALHLGPVISGGGVWLGGKQVRLGRKPAFNLTLICNPTPYAGIETISRRASIGESLPTTDDVDSYDVLIVKFAGKEQIKFTTDASLVCKKDQRPDISVNPGPGDWYLVSAVGRDDNGNPVCGATRYVKALSTDSAELQAHELAADLIVGLQLDHALIEGDNYQAFRRMTEPSYKMKTKEKEEEEQKVAARIFNKLKGVKTVKFTWVNRELNKLADIVADHGKHLKYDLFDPDRLVHYTSSEIWSIASGILNYEKRIGFYLIKKKTKVDANSAAEPIFREGMMVEVKSDKQGYKGAWYTAEIVCSVGSNGFLVEYRTLFTEDQSERLRERALASHIRPCPPEIKRIGYKVLEEVDAWYNGGWWIGIVSKVLDDWKYGVYFWTANKALIFYHSHLRVNQDLIGGQWTAPMRKRLKFQVSNRQCTGGHGEMGVEPNFVNGMKVEIKSGGENNEEIWYPAVILRLLGRHKYLVQYQTLMIEEGTQLIQEAFAPCIRPCPLVIHRGVSFKRPKKVDAWYGNGWRVGRIAKSFPTKTYFVYFKETHELLKFHHFELRPPS